MKLSRCSVRPLDLQVKVLDEDDVDVSRSMQGLAAVWIDQGKYEEAEGLCRQALEQMRTRLDEEHPHMLACMATLGHVLGVREKYEEAEGVLRQTMDVREKVFGKDHPYTLRSMSALASVLNSTGNVMEAEGLCRRALELWMSLLQCLAVKGSMRKPRACFGGQWSCGKRCLAKSIQTYSSA